MNESKHLTHEVCDPDDVGARADVVLGRHLPGLSRRMARRMALDGKLEIDGHRVAPSARVELGQKLVLVTEAPTGPTPTLTILQVTDAVVYVAKPPGIAVHRLRPDEPPTLADAVAEQFPECREVADDPREMGALHRLDRPTSGVVAFARSRAVWEAGRAGFTAGTVDKRYAAISRCAPPLGLESWLATPRPEGHEALPAILEEELRRCGVAPGVLPVERISAALGHGDQRGKVAVRGDGMPAVTHLQVLSEAGEQRFMLLRLLTGRRHQARGHLAAIGWPLCGDSRYGGAPAPRLLLHAWSLDLSAAIPGETAVVDPLPEDLRIALGADL
jgi:23S rRNA pseudouridine1911/1915/1917 synthase